MKKSFKNFLTACFMMVFALVLVPAGKAEAAYGLKQVNPQATTATVQWDAQDKATCYKVYEGATYSEMALVATLPATQTTYTFTGLKAGDVINYVRVEYEYPNFNNTGFYTSTAGTAYDVKTLPGKVSGVKQEQWWYYNKIVDVKWDKMPCADEYEWIARTSSGKKKASGTVSAYSAKASINKISNSSIYTLQVRAVTVINGERYYGDMSKKAYCLSQPRMKSIKVSGGKLTIKWAKVSGATGYDIYVSTKPKSGYKRVKSVGKSTFSVSIKKFSGKKISAKKKYYVYIAAKKKVGKTTHTSGKLYYYDSKNMRMNWFV